MTKSDGVQSRWGPVGRYITDDNIFEMQQFLGRKLKQISACKYGLRLAFACLIRTLRVWKSGGLTPAHYLRCVFHEWSPPSPDSALFVPRI